MGSCIISSLILLVGQNPVCRDVRHFIYLPGIIEAIQANRYVLHVLLPFYMYTSSDIAAHSHKVVEQFNAIYYSCHLLYFRKFTIF